MNRLSYPPVAIYFAWMWRSPTASEALTYGLNFLGEHAPRPPYNTVRYMRTDNCALHTLHNPPLYTYGPSFFNLWICPCVGVPNVRESKKLPLVVQGEECMHQKMLPGLPPPFCVLQVIESGWLEGLETRVATLQIVHEDKCMWYIWQCCSRVFLVLMIAALSKIYVLQ